MDELPRLIHANIRIAQYRDRLVGRFFEPGGHLP